MSTTVGAITSKFFQIISLSSRVLLFCDFVIGEKFQQRAKGKLYVKLEKSPTETIYMVKVHSPPAYFFIFPKMMIERKDAVLTLLPKSNVNRRRHWIRSRKMTLRKYSRSDINVSISMLLLKSTILKEIMYKLE